MATISEAFLNSMPEDERAEFLQEAFELLALKNPSEQDEIAQKIRGWYDGHQGRVTKCSYCRKDEPDDKEFGQCARCGLALYCSKECQKRHWKQHKIDCEKSEDGEKAALYKKISCRMNQFCDFYTPIIHRLVLNWYRLYNKEMDTGDILFPEDTVVEIEVADLPQGAKRPRLYIKKVIVGKLFEDEKEKAYARFSLPQPGYKRVRYCLSYSYGPGENDTLYSHSQFQHRVDPAERSKFNRSSKKLYWENTYENQDFINSVAKGESPKIYKVIKEVLKEKNE